MPPERSHHRAAADLHGASSARSMALALVVQIPRSTHATAIIFMLNGSLIFGRKGRCYREGCTEASILCVAKTPPEPQLCRRRNTLRIRNYFL
jgi:hypothetical protein